MKRINIRDIQISLEVEDIIKDAEHQQIRSNSKLPNLDEIDNSREEFKYFLKKRKHSSHI